MNLSECYEILGINRDASDVELKIAYRKQVKVYHPDVNDEIGTQEMFLIIQHAYETIKKYLKFKESYGDSLSEILINAQKEKENERKIQEKERLLRIIRAYKIKEKREQEEKNKIIRAFEEYKNSWRIQISKVVTVLGVFIAILICFDLLLYPDCRKISIKDVVIESYGFYKEHYLVFDDGDYYVSESFFYNAVTQKVLMQEKTPLFGVVKRIYYTKGNSEYSEWAHSIFYESLPFIVLLLLIPLVSFFYMRPDFTFVFFFVHFNVYIAPVLILFVLFGDLRFLKLIDSMVKLIY